MKGYTVNHWHRELNIIVVNIVNIHVIIWNALNINTTYTEQTSLVDFALSDLLSSNGHSSHSLVLWCLVHLFSNEVIIFKQKDKYTLWKMIKLKIYIEVSKYIKLFNARVKESYQLISKVSLEIQMCSFYLFMVPVQKYQKSEW